MAARRTGTPNTTATATRCPSCRAPLLKQTVEVLEVVADAAPIPPGTDRQHTGPNHLVWCAPPPRAGAGPPRLRWIWPGHPPDCPHPHHREHRCTGHRPPAAPPANTLF